jgi:DNA-binding NarL/FixJ family response regulator
MHSQHEGDDSLDSLSYSVSEVAEPEHAHAVSRKSDQVFIIETGSLATTSQHQLAKWLAAEAASRGLVPRLLGVEEIVPDARLPLAEGDVVLMMLHQPAADFEQADLAVTWAQWSQLAAVVIDSGATLILVTAGAQAASVAACLGQGAHAVVELDHAERALDVAKELQSGELSAFDLASVLVCPYDEEQLARLGSLTTIELRVLFYLTKGYAADRIASVEWISLSTVRTHIRAIFRKLRVNSQLAAVALANGTGGRDLAPQEEPSVT